VNFHLYILSLLKNIFTFIKIEYLYNLSKNASLDNGQNSIRS